MVLRSKGYVPGRSTNPNHPPASTQSHGEPHSEMSSHHKLMILSDKTHGILGVGQSHATVIAGKREMRGQEDIEMLPSTTPADGEISVQRHLNMNWA